MKLLVFYLCLLVILLQAIFASSSLNKGCASLTTDKESGGSKAKKVVGKRAKKKKSTGVKKLQGKKLLKKGAGKIKGIGIKKNRSKSLIEFLPDILVKIVVGYFIDTFYPFVVSKHSWALHTISEIAVDSARLYVKTSEGIKGLSHSLANVEDDERRLTEFGDPRWRDYWHLRSSHDGRYVSFNHGYKASTDQREQDKSSAKWLTQSNDLECGNFKHLSLDDEGSFNGILSRDGQTLCSPSCAMNPITRVYRIMKETGKDPIGFVKFNFIGAVAYAVSGKGNRVFLEKGIGLGEIHDIGENASKLICQIDTTGLMYNSCVLNEDGSEAAFVNSEGNELRIMEVDKVNGSATDQPAIVTVKIPERLESFIKLVYDDEGKLYTLHYGGKISLFDPSKKELILLEAPQEVQMHADQAAISPNADYIAVLIVGKGENGKTIQATIVKKRFNDADMVSIFGYKAGKNKQAAKP